MLAFLLIIGIATGQEKLTFSVEEAMDYAVRNNYSVINAELDIESARKEVWKTAATGLPQVNGTLDYQYLPGDLPVLSFPDNMGGTQDVTLGVKSSATYNVTVSQLVFSGEYIVGLQAARVYMNLSRQSAEKAGEETKELISSSYYTILVLERNLEILDSSKINLESIVRETGALVETGFLEETDYDQLLITFNTVENSIQAVERQIALAYKIFKIQLGLKINDEIELTDQLDRLVLDAEDETLLLTEFVLENNIDYQILATQERLSLMQLRREQARFLPSVSGFYLYQDKTQKADFDVTFNHVLGLNLSVPIFSSGQKLASVSQARITFEQSKNNKTTLSENLLLGYEQARADLLDAYNNFDTQKQNVDLARTIYEKTYVKYREGVVSSMDLTQANDQYLNAYSTLNGTVLTLLSARTRLEKILNEI